MINKQYFWEKIHFYDIAVTTNTLPGSNTQFLDLQLKNVNFYQHTIKNINLIVVSKNVPN